MKGCVVHWVTRLEGRWDRSVIVASGLWAARPRNCGSNSGRGKIFVVSTTLRVPLRSFLLQVHVVLGVKWLEQ